jgi:predicted ATPase/DNA-binding SARP family transcriptional activator
VVEFRILGSVEVLVDGRPAPLGAPKQRAVLAKLLLARGAVVPRDELVEAVWADEPPDSASGALQVYVHGLRRVLGTERIQRQGSGYRLPLSRGELDLDRFDELLLRAERSLVAGDAAGAAAELETALALWRGPPLADLAGEPVAEAEGGRLEESRLHALELRNDAQLALGAHAGIVGELERLIAAEPYRERFREQLVLALYRSGRQKEALDSCGAARTTLLEELGVEPGPDLRELELAILRHDPALAAPPPRDAPTVKLPAPATRLIGRRLEIAAVASLLGGDDVRLVTLIGPGGTGKTRLAIAVAAELADTLRDGAVFVDFAGVRDPELVATTITQVLGVKEGDLPVEDALANRLRDKRLLLVLDNLEQLLDGVRVISGLLAAAPRLLVLATSREPLRLYGEHRYLVPPLDAVDAERLFFARAAAVRSGFTLDEAAESSVAEICRRLEGLPLAIELAAARSSVLAPAAIARNLAASLDLLTGGARDLPPRQQTLRATLDWSHDLLTPAERTLFARLGVFAGGWTATAANAVCGDADSLESLVEKNLLRRSDYEGSRFAMLETIREYALERLSVAGETDHVADRHARFFLNLAEDVDRKARDGGLDQAPLFDTIDVEHDNLRASLEHLHRVDAQEEELRLASALQYFWVVRGHLAEGRAWLERALDSERSAPPALRAKALASAGRLAYRQGDFEHARRRYAESLAAARESGDERAIGQALSDLGGVASAEGDADRAEALWVQSAEVLRRAGHLVRLATVLGNRAGTATARGDLTNARALAEEALALQDASGDREGRIFTLLELGRVALREEQAEEAASRLHEGLALAHELGFRDVSGYCLHAIAELALLRDDAALAARLGGAADGIFESVGITRLQADDLEIREGILAAVETALGHERTMLKWDEGRIGFAQVVVSELEQGPA